MRNSAQRNMTAGSVLLDMLLAFVSLFLNGLGVYLTIHADIGAGPWDVFGIGLSKTLGILYGNASITVGVLILVIDILLREPIGIAMVIDALTVGKAVDFFNWLDIVPVPKTLIGGVAMMILGLFILAYTQFIYMWCALGCGPRDTLLVGLARRVPKIPIGAVSIAMLAVVTFAGWLLGGPVGVGTLICAFVTGPIMQFAFRTVRFDATAIRHQNIGETFRIFLRAIKKQP